MKYTYVFPGHGRTGTTSLWRMLKDHPQVSVSVEKDYLRDHQNLDIYIKNAFIINDQTKVLFDGMNGYVEMGLKTLEELERLCCIFIMRDLKTKIVSTLDLINKQENKKIANIGYIRGEDGNIDYHTMTKKVAWYCVNEYDYLRRVEEVTGKDNILIMKFGEIEAKQGKIYRFLGIDDNIKLKYRKLNSAVSFNPNVQQLKDKIEMRKWTDALFNKTIQEISDEQIELIHERYNVI